MYFGSVRFFKHLIIAVLALMIIIPTTICVAVVRENAKKDEEIEVLLRQDKVLEVIREYYDESGKLTPEALYQIMVEYNINTEDFIEILKEKDPMAADAYAEKTDVPADSLKAEIKEEPIITTTTEETVPDEDIEEDISLYADLYPELVAPTISNNVYIDDEGYIYLTFDDGPNANTADILGYLDKYDIKATFFVIPKATEECRNYLNTILEKGHTLGIHTYTHEYNKIYANVESYLEDFYQAYQLIYAQTGYRPYLYRFPGGSYNDFNTGVADDIILEMTRRGFVYFDWNVDSTDALGSDWTTMYNKVLREVSETTRSVVLFHDLANTLYVLDDILRELTTSPNNYVFSAIKEDTRPIHF